MASRSIEPGSDSEQLIFAFCEGKVAQIDQLHPGLAAKEVRQIIPDKPTRGPDELMGADGAYHQEWKYAKAGIT